MIETKNKRVFDTGWQPVDFGRERPTMLAGHSLRKANANLNAQVCFEGIGAWKQLATANAI